MKATDAENAAISARVAEVYRELKKKFPRPDVKPNDPNRDLILERYYDDLENKAIKILQSQKP